MDENNGAGREQTDDSGLPLDRRRFLASATAGALGLGASGSASAESDGSGSEERQRETGPPFAETDHTHDGDALGVEEPVDSITAETVNDVEYVDVAEGAQAVQAAVDEADEEGHNGVVVYGDEGEWNETVRLPSDFTLDIRDGVTITSSMSAEDADTFEVGHGTVGAALITNEDHENGDRNVAVRGGFVDFADVPDGDVVWAPVWLHDCDRSRLDSVRVENVAGPYGLMFSNCRDSVMVDCVGRNVGYDGIAVRLDCRRVDVYRCEAYECGGPGIQAATFGRGAGAPRDVNFVNCRTDEMIAFHGYPEVGGAQNVSVHGCFAGRIGIIGEVTDFRISDCDVNSVALSALGDTIRNGRVDSVTFGERTDEFPGSAATILWAFDGGLIENVSYSNCTAHGLERFVECRMPAESAAARYIDYTDSAFDGADADGPTTFVQNQTAGELSNLRLHSCKVWNVESVVEGPVDGLRIRDTELRDVGELHDGEVTDLETRDNDRW